MLLLYLWAAQEILLLRLRKKSHLRRSDLNQKAQDVVGLDDSEIKSTVNSVRMGVRSGDCSDL